MNKTLAWLVTILVSGTFFMSPKNTSAATTRKIIFPVAGTTSYSNDFGAPRVGHTHIGNDIFGVKGQVLVAAVDGTIRQASYPEPSYGWYLSLTDADGYQYNYLHINNDTPGTDDGKGGAVNAYQFGTGSGWPVRAGQAIAYMGDSGNAETTRAHLHFEIEDPNGKAFNPFFSLQAARKIKAPKSRARRDGEVIPFPGTTLGLRVASGQIDPTTPTDELVVAQSQGPSPKVRIFREAVTRLSEFTVREATGTGGVDVAVGDTNGDGTDEVIVGFGRGNEPYVQVTNADGSVLSSFLAYPKKFRGGVNVAAADLDGDGRDEIITGAGPGGGPNVRVFSFAGDVLASFDAYESTFHGGVDVAGRTSGETGSGIIMTVSGPGRVTEIKIFDRVGGLMNSWIGYTADTVAGARIAFLPASGSEADSLATIPAGKSTSLTRRFGLDGQLWNEERIFERWWFGDFDIGTWRGTFIGATGPKRPTSIAPLSASFRPWWWSF